VCKNLISKLSSYLTKLQIPVQDERYAESIFQPHISVTPENEVLNIIRGAT
jgi:hypothetical protein